LNLNTLSNSIDSVILDRGREYVSRGCVRSIEETENGVYVAAVRGNGLYEVVIELDDDDEVLSLECDCPYDFGPICKHEAAVLLELRDECGPISKRENGNDSATASVSRIPVDLRAMLESASKESLVALLVSLAEESDIVERRIRLALSPISGQEAVEQCRQLIRSSIRLHWDNHGFVNWRQS